MSNRMGVFALALGALALLAILAIGLTKLAILPFLAVIDVVIALAHWFGVTVSL